MASLLPAARTAVRIGHSPTRRWRPRSRSTTPLRPRWQMPGPALPAHIRALGLEHEACPFFLSAANVGADKDSDKRQRATIAAFAKAAGYTIVDEFYDAAVSGSDPVGERPGFKAMLDRIASNGVRIIVVESPDRFARDLAVQLAGHDYLKALGVELIPASAPDFFIEDTPTAVLVRQVLGAIAQFEKASLVAKLRAARERKKAAGGRGSGRFTYAQRVPATVALAKELHGQRMSLREISAALAAQGHVTGGGKPYTASAVQTMLHRK